MNFKCKRVLFEGLFLKTMGVIVFCLLIIQPGSTAKAGSNSIPENIDPKARYLFFMHGKIVEMRGAYASHPRHGAYDYYGILKAFKAEGFTVISEVRPDGTQPPQYAKKIAGQVGKLLAGGVAPKSIVVSGFSKGGSITLIVSSILKNPDINFIVMAGCGKPGSQFRRNYAKFLSQRASGMRGRFLSIVDSSDDSGGSCSEAFNAGQVTSKEIITDTGLGHGLFYEPRKEWLNPVLDWLK